MDFSEKLQKLRQDRNLTQEQLAEQLFVSRTAISKWESGRGYPSIDSLKAISKLFTVSIDDLLSGEELITIAETDSEEKIKNVRTIVFGFIDCMPVLMLFLPLFAQRGETMIESVSLLSLTVVNPFMKFVYFSWVAAIALCGLLTLALQSVQDCTWTRRGADISLALSVIGTLAFMLSLQPYPAALIFFTLLLKGILLLKR